MAKKTFTGGWGWGWVAGPIENNQVEVEAELGKRESVRWYYFTINLLKIEGTKQIGLQDKSNNQVGL